MSETVKKDTDKTFPKEERLCSTKSIERLFSSGNSFIAYPLRVVFYTEKEPDEDKRKCTVLINISKKKFKHAVKRNRVKRLIKEAYRLNKYKFSDLLNRNECRMDIAFLYLKNELPEYIEIEKSILKTATILSEKLGKIKEEEGKK